MPSSGDSHHALCFVRNLVVKARRDSVNLGERFDPGCGRHSILSASLAQVLYRRQERLPLYLPSLSCHSCPHCALWGFDVTNTSQSNSHIPFSTEGWLFKYMGLLCRRGDRETTTALPSHVVR